MATRWKSVVPVLGSLVLVSAAVTAGARDDDRNGDLRPQAYSNHVLVSDGNVPADFTDANLVNGWGVAFNPNGPVWVSDNGTGKSTLYDGTGKPQSLVVTIPGAGGEHSAPTGVVFAGGTWASFYVAESAPLIPDAQLARFIRAASRRDFADDLI